MCQCSRRSVCLLCDATVTSLRPSTPWVSCMHARMERVTGSNDFVFARLVLIVITGACCVCAFSLGMIVTLWIINGGNKWSGWLQQNKQMTLFSLLAMQRPLLCTAQHSHEKEIIALKERKVREDDFILSLVWTSHWDVLCRAELLLGLWKLPNYHA